MDFLEVQAKGRACFSGKVGRFQQFQCQKHFLFFNDLELS